MPKAVWRGAIIAEADDDAVEIVEGNVYFPMSAVHQAYLQDSDTVTHCHWKGAAHYYHVAIDGQVNRDAAWIYREPLDAARQIANHVAFWHGVQVER